MKQLMNRCVGVLLFVCISIQVQGQEKPYLGAEIRTIETFLYGKFEVRMKTAEASGMVYSFFTFYDETDFASKWNEVDVEFLGRYTNEVQFNTIVGNHQKFEKRHELPFNPHDDYHIYAFSWTPKYIAWSIDGVEVYRQNGEHIAKMNRPQKIMMNVWASSSVAWAGKIDPTKFPLVASYDYVSYYAYQPKTTDTFKLKWTDPFDIIDNGRWQLATHTFDTNECVFTPDNARVGEGFLELMLTRTIDEDVVVTPDVFIESAKVETNTSKKYINYIPVRVQFYAPINKIFVKSDYFKVTEGVVVHSYFDVERMYVILYVDGLDIRKIKKQQVLYSPTGNEKYNQEISIK
jgi:beta-glucanase (GH16 family)